MIPCLSTFLLYAGVKLNFLRPVQIEKQKGLIEYWCVASQLLEVLEKVQALSSNSEDLEAYIADRQHVTFIVMKVRVSVFFVLFPHA